MAHLKTDKFSIVVRGTGNLVAMVESQLMENYRNAAVHDRTPQFLQFVRNEIALGRSKFADRKFRRSVPQLERNLAHEPNADVTYNGQHSPSQREVLTVSGKRGKREFAFDFAEDSVGTWEDLERLVRQAIDAALLVF